MRISRKDLNLIVATQTPRKPRGAWVHYVCPACSDKSGHLGVNTQTGAVKCVRCGATGSLHDNQGIVRGVRGKTMRINGEEVVRFDEGPVEVLSYMVGRGITLPPSPETWGYGVGWAEGNPVFMARKPDGTLAYVQMRTSNPNSRYEAVPNTVPIVDSFGVGNGVMILTEGPISALKAMQVSGIPARPAWGAQPKASTIRSIIDTDVKKVVVMFDPDTPGIRGAARVSTMLNMMGIKSSTIPYSRKDVLSGRDPADMPEDRLLQLVGSAL